MYFTVYKITNKINGKTYIGKHKTDDLNDGYMGSGKLISRAIKKHGIENFVKEYLFIYDNEHDMNDTEATLVTEEYCLREDTYNLCRGGQGGFSYVNRVGKNIYGMNGENGKQALKKARCIQKELWKNSDYRNKESISRSLRAKKWYAQGNENPFKGKRHSNDSKQKISSSNSSLQSGSKNSQFGTMWITNGIDSKKIKTTDPIDEGWKKGRKIKK